MFKRSTLVLAFLLVLTSTVWGAPPAREVQTDLMIDDIFAMVPLSHEYRSTRGRGLLLVAVGGDTHEKARALHTLCYLLGIPEAQIVPGDRGPERPDVRYVGDYKQNDGHEAFVRALAEFRGPTKLKMRDYIAESTRFRRAYGNTSPLFIASSHSFMQTNIEQEHAHFSQFDIGAFWKYGEPYPAPALSAFNMNDSRASAVKLLDFAQRHRIPVNAISSDLVQTSAELAAALREPQRALMQNPAHRHIMKTVLDGMKGYRDELANILSRTYGLKAPFVTLWDPEQESWVQDTILVMAALNPGLVKGWRSVDVKVAEALHENGLGFAVTTTPSKESVIREAESLDRAALVVTTPTQFAKVTFTPDFSPEQAINPYDKTPICFVTKTSIDDMGALRMFLGMDERLKLVITESTHTPTLSAVMNEILFGFGRSKQVKVVTGVGDTDDRMATIPSLDVLERHLNGTGLLAEGVLSPASLAALKRLDPSTYDASNQLIEFLEQHPMVDLVVATSARTVALAFARRPELLARVRTLHIMAGVRNPQLAEDQSGGWTGGEPTRNTEIDIAAAEALVDYAQKSGVRTFYYSSHLSGGMLNADNFQLSMPIWSQLRATHPVEKQIERLRLNWNDGLIQKGKKVNRDTNYGPPLSWLMAAMVALGDKGTQYFSATPGKLVFKGGKIDFTADPTSSLQVMDVQDTYLYLDQITAHLSRKAHAKSPGPARRALASALGCLRDLFSFGGRGVGAE